MWSVKNTSHLQTKKKLTYHEKLDELKGLIMERHDIDILSIILEI